MRQFNASDAKQKFGLLIDAAQREPVEIRKHGRPVAVLISDSEYADLKRQRLQSILRESAEQADRGALSPVPAIDDLMAEVDADMSEQS